MDVGDAVSVGDNRRHSRVERIGFRVLLKILVVAGALLLGLLCYSRGSRTEQQCGGTPTSHAYAGVSGRRLVVEDGVDDYDPVYVVTPTYNDVRQIVHLTRHLWLLASVPSIVWVIVQDDEVIDPYVERFLSEQMEAMLSMPFYRDSSLEVVYLARGRIVGVDERSRCRGRLGRNRAFEEVYARAAYPELAMADKAEGREAGQWFVQKGVSRRLSFDGMTPRADLKGWLYFLDDDNSISPRLFTEIRKITTVGVWPVGNMGRVMTSSPLVFPNNTVGSFLDGWTQREYKMDMAGFGFSLQWMHRRAKLQGQDFDKYWELDYCKKGGMENILLKKAVDDKSQLQPLAKFCSEVYVWHTQTKWIGYTKVGYRHWLYRRQSIFVNAKYLLRDLEHHGLKQKSFAQHPPPFLGLPANSFNVDAPPNVDFKGDDHGFGDPPRGLLQSHHDDLSYRHHDEIVGDADLANV